MNEAGKHLTTASGVMDYIVSKLLSDGWSANRFHVDPNILNPPELDPRVCTALAALFMGSAQMVSVAKAVSLEKRPPPLVLSKLCVGVMNTMHKGISYLDGTSEPAIQSVMAHMIIMKQFFGGLAYRYAAQSHFEAHETGVAMGCCSAGKVFC